ncbi:hypothetical protein B0J17DRAFT_682299 [Rhizoctonia solani]|nr:hypothetical protein B0J17DRAFT_682299 [Rhizoctonia solani]
MKGALTLGSKLLVCWLSFHPLRNTSTGVAKVQDARSRTPTQLLRLLAPAVFITRIATIVVSQWTGNIVIILWSIGRRAVSFRARCLLKGVMPLG